MKTPRPPEDADPVTWILRRIRDPKTPAKERTLLRRALTRAITDPSNNLRGRLEPGGKMLLD